MWKNKINDIDFCVALDINKSAVTDWKKGKTKSYLKYIDKIAEYFGVSMDYFLDNTDETKEKSPSFPSEDESKELSINNIVNKVKDLNPDQQLILEDILKLFQTDNIRAAEQLKDYVRYLNSQ
jgi:transcriptional regulator with XRE-family HTH domain